MINVPTVIIVRECTKMMPTIPPNEYQTEVIVKEQEMRSEMMAIQYLMMDAVQTDHK